MPYSCNRCPATRYPTRSSPSMPASNFEAPCTGASSIPRKSPRPRTSLNTRGQRAATLSSLVPSRCPAVTIIGSTCVSKSSAASAISAEKSSSAKVDVDADRSRRRTARPGRAARRSWPARRRGTWKAGSNCPNPGFRGGQERAGSPHPALDLVEDQRGAMTIRQVSQCLKNVVGNFAHPTLALYRLGETRRDRGQVVLRALRHAGSIWLDRADRDQF